MVTAAADMVGISFPKLKRFATILNLKMFESDTFFRLRGKHLIIRVYIFRFTVFQSVFLFLYSDKLTVSNAVNINNAVITLDRELIIFL